MVLSVSVAGIGGHWSWSTDFDVCRAGDGGDAATHDVTLTLDSGAARSRPARGLSERPQVTSSSHHLPDFVVFGVDYGTLSGRTVVVRVDDGREFGRAVHDHARAVLDRALPTGESLPPEWPLKGAC